MPVLANNLQCAKPWFSHNVFQFDALKLSRMARACLKQ